MTTLNNLSPSITLCEPIEAAGILLLNKPAGKTSFSMVSALRRILKVKKIGHAGTLDLFATGVLIMLIGKKFTRLSDQFLNCNKEYVARLKLGIETDTYDCDGIVVSESTLMPLLEEVKTCLMSFQGEIMQIPPMFSAKKIQGKKLYDLARKGLVIERSPTKIHVACELLHYQYPFVDLKVTCSKGTYIRSIAHDLGKALKCGAHLSTLQRTRSGAYHLAQCFDSALLDQPNCSPLLLNALKQTWVEHEDLLLPS